MGLFGNLFSSLGDVATGGLFSLGSSVISGIAANKAQRDANAANLQIAKMNNQAAADMMRENNEFNRQAAIDMFNMENEYNDPSKQVERLRAAGINPSAVLDGGGTQVMNSGSAGTPSAVGVPSLSSPMMQPVPSIAASSLESLATLAKASSDFASGRKSDADVNRTNSLLDAELRNILADARYKDAMTSYQTLQENLDRLYEDDRRIGEIKQQAADFALALQKGEFEKAHTLYMQAEKALTDSKSDQVRQSTPFIVDNLKKTGRAILAQINASNAAAEQSRANARLANANAETADQIRASQVRMSEALAKEKEAHAEVANSTTMQQIEHWRNMVKLDEKKAAQVDEMIRKAKKENDWYEVNQIVGIAKTVSDEIQGFMSLGISKMGRSTTRNIYSSDGTLVNTVDENSYLY